MNVSSFVPSQLSRTAQLVPLRVSSHLFELNSSVNAWKTDSHGHSPLGRGVSKQPRSPTANPQCSMLFSCYVLLPLWCSLKMKEVCMCRAPSDASASPCLDDLLRFKCQTHLLPS